MFNLLFVKQMEQKYVVHCLDCARKTSSTLDSFSLLEEYKIEDLMDVYDNFVLHTVSTSTVPSFVL